MERICYGYSLENFKNSVKQWRAHLPIAVQVMGHLNGKVYHTIVNKVLTGLRDLYKKVLQTYSLDKETLICTLDPVPEHLMEQLEEHLSCRNLEEREQWVNTKLFQVFSVEVQDEGSSTMSWTSIESRIYDDVTVLLE